MIIVRRKMLCGLALAAVVVTGSACGEEFFVTNQDTSDGGAVAFLDALNGRGVAEISPTDTIDIQGRVFVDDAAGPSLRCAGLRIGAGPDNTRGGGLYLRKVELQVDGDIMVSAPPRTSADLHVEWLGLLGWTGRLEISGAGGTLAWAGARSLNGGSLSLEGGTLRFKVQTRQVMDRVFTSNRPALITLDGEFLAGNETVVHLLLEQEAEGASLPAGEFLLVRFDKMAGDVPRLVVDGAAPDQMEKISLKSGDGGLMLVVDAGE
jgi:hypothetical protein